MKKNNIGEHKIEVQQFTCCELGQYVDSMLFDSGTEIALAELIVDDRCVEVSGSQGRGKGDL